MKMIRVISTKTGFRRAGRAWSGTTELPAAELTKQQLEQLESEPLLVVQEFDQADEELAGSEASGKPPVKRR